MKRFVIILFMFLTDSFGFAKTAQSWEKIVPYERTYKRIDESCNFIGQLLLWPEKVVITYKDLYHVLDGPAKQERVYIMGASHSSSYWWAFPITFERFNEHYEDN